MEVKLPVLYTQANIGLFKYRQYTLDTNIGTVTLLCGILLLPLPGCQTGQGRTQKRFTGLWQLY